MQCPKCNCILHIGQTFMSFEGENTPESPIKAFTNMPMICVNNNCDQYGGSDLSDPYYIIETLKHPLN